MAEDREVLKSVWEGKIPVCFVLAEDDLYSAEQPQPIYYLVPRVTYFPVVLEKVQRQFEKHTRACDQAEVWLDFESQPLKWHCPVGLLFDLYGDPSKLPWRVTVHFSNFPEEELLHCPSKDCVESHFMSTVKEADCLKHRSQIINSMQRRDHKQLWAGLQNDRFDQFWAVNRKLMEPIKPNSAGGDDLPVPSATNSSASSAPGNTTVLPPVSTAAGFRYIPCRLYLTEEASGTYVQRLVRPFTESGEALIYADLVRLLAPRVMARADKYRLLLHGVSIPDQTPVQWLSEHMSYPDNFLHICAVKL